LPNFRSYLNFGPLWYSFSRTLADELLPKDSSIEMSTAFNQVVELVQKLDPSASRQTTQQILHKYLSQEELSSPSIERQIISAVFSLELVGRSYSTNRNGARSFDDEPQLSGVNLPNGVVYYLWIFQVNRIVKLEYQLLRTMPLFR
ncbi:hypothetical protein PHET_00405, partial [Paragonimus heterotremus]